MECQTILINIPINGIEEAAGGVDSASNNNKTKKATNIFIPKIYKISEILCKIKIRQVNHILQTVHSWS